MSTGVVIRDDVAYVGQFGTTTFTAIATVNDSTGAFYTLCGSNTVGSNLVLSRGYIGTQLSTTTAASLTPVYLQWNPTTSSISIHNSAGASVGYIGLSATNDLIISATSTPLVLVTTDPAGYGTGLLAGCRYSISTSTLNSSTIKSNVDNGTAITTGDYAGLYTNTSTTNSITMDKVLWSFIPTAPVYLTPDSVPVTPATIQAPLAISQCIYLQGVAGYGTSDVCKSWKNGAGFTTEADSQLIPYFYSEDKSCGDGYTFTNFLNKSTVVSSSNGACTENSCVYSADDKVFACRDEEGILHKWWFWGLVILLFLIVIVIVAVIVIAASKRKSKTM